MAHITGTQGQTTWVQCIIGWVLVATHMQYFRGKHLSKISTLSNAFENHHVEPQCRTDTWW